MTTDGTSKRRPFSWRERRKSFLYAFSGVRRLVADEHNARIHLAAAALAVGFGCWLRISAVEWCLIIICIGSVLAMEAVNTAIEALADRITTDYSPLIKTAKDVAAAAVFMVALAALAVGVIVFLPKLLAL